MDTLRILGGNMCNFDPNVRILMFLKQQQRCPEYLLFETNGESFSLGQSYYFEYAAKIYLNSFVCKFQNDLYYEDVYDKKRVEIYKTEVDVLKYCHEVINFELLLIELYGEWTNHIKSHNQYNLTNMSSAIRRGIDDTRCRLKPKKNQSNLYTLRDCNNRNYDVYCMKNSEGVIGGYICRGTEALDFTIKPVF